MSGSDTSVINSTDHAMSAIEFLTLAAGGVGLTIVSLFAIAVLWAIFRGKIDLSMMLSEADGNASLSRFQFLVFTFVIGFSIVFVTLAGEKLPEVGASIMALLGISGGSYVVSKGIQNANNSKLKDEKDKSGWPNG